MPIEILEKVNTDAMFALMLENTRDRFLKKNQKQIAPIAMRHRDGDLAVVSLSGKIDSSSAASLRIQVEELSSSGIRKLVLDLPDVTSMDSAGLGEIVSIANHFAANGGEVCLAALSDRLKLLFEYAKLHFVFKAFQTISEATEYLKR